MVFVYSVADRGSFEDIAVLHKGAKDFLGSMLQSIVVATFMDVEEYERKVTTQEGKQLAESLQASFVETSGKLGMVYQLKQCLVDKLRDQYKTD